MFFFSEFKRFEQRVFNLLLINLLIFQELCDKPIENKLVVFSCSHYYISQLDYEKEIGSVIGELDRLRLFSCSELVNRLFSGSNFTTCCPNCLFHYIESQVISKTREEEEKEEAINI